MVIKLVLFMFINGRQEAVGYLIVAMCFYEPIMSRKKVKVNITYKGNVLLFKKNNLSKLVK